VRELLILGHRDHYEMIAISFLYLYPSFNLLAWKNVWFCCGSCRCMFCHGVTKMEKNNPEQLYGIRFCVKVREVATDTYDKIQRAFGNDSLSRAQVFRWHEDFVNRRESLEDTLQSGRLTSERWNTNIDFTRALFRQKKTFDISNDCRWT
jgi:hypothetical protein